MTHSDDAKMSGARARKRYLTAIQPKPYLTLSQHFLKLPGPGANVSSRCACTHHPFPMGCCSSTANVPPDSPVMAENASPPVATPIPATPLASEHSSATLPQPSSRRKSSHPTHRVIEGPDQTNRDRRKSAPEQPPLPMQSSPSQDRRIRAQTFTAPIKGSYPAPRPPNPGEDDAWWGHELLMTVL